jgi:UDPglucose--hexose-1-phosphate uridylyltransferase
LIFENKGEIVGVSNPHPHCQIYAVDFTINVVKKELDAAAEYRKERDRNVFSDIIDAEKKDDIRIIAEKKVPLHSSPILPGLRMKLMCFLKNVMPR